MADENLDDLPSPELHARAVRLAKERHDVGFLWELLRSLPAAEATIGDMERSETDIMRVFGLVTDLIGAGEEPLADALRPLYLDYLKAHLGDG
ncbi:hypothetical protein LO762_05085 [Actinocorallia sp. API 0066]|uniref:hypothetical protein n=1 Tax=Actinocorallia sp. API 0066 TaxID=2896846 RepID=UPI001E2964A4|nr:hypothetical protein [Actinocorallia sp. API 0066]MCD0448572.1 hypothetical protein [Actinocorallia sp. API 0066]